LQSFQLGLADKNMNNNKTFRNKLIQGVLNNKLFA